MTDKEIFIEVFEVQTPGDDEIVEDNANQENSLLVINFMVLETAQSSMTQSLTPYEDSDSYQG